MRLASIHCRANALSGSSLSQICTNDWNSEQLVKIGIIRGLADIPALRTVCPGKRCDKAASEMIGDLACEDSQIEVAVSSPCVTAVDETDVAVRADDQVAQCQIAMRDDNVLRWRIRSEAREQVQGCCVAVSRGKMSRIDVTLLNGVARSLKPHGKAFVEGAFSRGQGMQPSNCTAYDR